MRWMWLAVVLLLASPAAAETRREALIRRGVALELRQDLGGALRVYAELEQLRGHRGIGLLLRARVAFMRKDYESARNLAQRAVASATGSWQALAKVLYGDALYAEGQYQRAKQIFLVLREQAGDRTELGKRVIACNKALRLPDRDGL